MLRQIGSGNDRIGPRGTVHRLDTLLQSSQPRAIEQHLVGDAGNSGLRLQPGQSAIRIDIRTMIMLGMQQQIRVMARHNLRLEENRISIQDEEPLRTDEGIRT